MDNNRVINITDPIDILRYLIGGAPLSCLDAADFNDDGKVDITDAVSSLDFLFREGSPPPAPYPNLGTDPTDDGIGC